MLRRKSLRVLALSLLVSLALIASLAHAQLSADQRDRVTNLRVEITNLTYGQILAPPVVAIHSVGAHIFEAGAPASDGLATLAEDGDGSVLMAELMSDSRMSHVMSGSGVIMPGETATIDLTGVGEPARLSIVGMLVSTNDAFFGLDGAVIAGGPWVREFSASAWDAGSETNNESCDFIPGPPCGNPGVRDSSGAEGFVHVHRGIHGTGDLMAADRDWRGPVVKITVERTTD